jgi:ABC-type sugar transport system permease subunit
MTAATAQAGKTGRTSKARRYATGYAFVLPWLCGLTFFIAYPFLAAGYFSFCDFPPLKDPMFIGTANYAELLTDPVFHRCLGVTTMFAAVAIPLGVLLAMSLAMFLNARIRGQALYRVVYYLPHLVPTVVVAILWMWIFNAEAGLLNLVLRTVFRGWDWWTGLFFSPVALAEGRWSVYSHWVWTPSSDNWVLPSLADWVFQPGSIHPQAGFLLLAIVLALLCWGPMARRIWRGDSQFRRFVATAAGLAVAVAVLAVLAAVLYRYRPADMRKLHAPGWLTDGDPFPAGVPFAPPWALWSLIIMSMWGVGQMAVIYLAKLQDVPAELYEAADIDGATWWDKTFHVTIPLISPVILFNVVMAIIGAFQVFAEPYIMTQGGPEDKTRFVAMFIYDQAFQYHRLGYASAVAGALFLIIVVLTILSFRLSRNLVHYEGR